MKIPATGVPRRGRTHEYDTQLKSWDGDGLKMLAWKQRGENSGGLGDMVCNKQKKGSDTHRGQNPPRHSEGTREGEITSLRGAIGLGLQGSRSECKHVVSEYQGEVHIRRKNGKKTG